MRNRGIVLGLVVLTLVGTGLVFSLSILAEERTFKIALCLTFGGSTGSWGRIFSQGDQMVADHFNARGGLNKRRIE